MVSLTRPISQLEGLSKYRLHSTNENNDASEENPYHMNQEHALPCPHFQARCGLSADGTGTGVCNVHSLTRGLKLTTPAGTVRQQKEKEWRKQVKRQ